MSAGWVSVQQRVRTVALSGPDVQPPITTLYLDCGHQERITGPAMTLGASMAPGLAVRCETCSQQCTDYLEVAHKGLPHIIELALTTLDHREPGS